MDTTTHRPIDGRFTSLHDEGLEAVPGPEVRRFQQALAEDLGNADAWWKYAVALSDYQWLNRDAANAVSMAIALDPLRAEYHHFRGYCHLKLGLLQEAAADNTASLALDAKHWGAAYYLGMTLFYMHEYGRALDVYDRMWAMTPPNAQWAAYSNWYYLSARKVRDAQRAAHALSKITEDSKPQVSRGTLGNTWDDAAYLAACKAYAGWRTPDDVLAEYAPDGAVTFDCFTACLLMGLYFDVEGAPARTRALFERIMRLDIARERSPSVAWIVEPWLGENG